MPENSLFDIKKRVTAAKQTRKITGTMELIASSRLYSGRILLSNYQEWAKQIRKAARCLPDSYFEPIAGSAGVKEKAYIVFVGSKGLSGSYGPNLLEYAAPLVSGHMVISVGSGAETYFPDAYQYFDAEAPSSETARSIARTACKLYESKRVKEVSIIYMRGVDPLSERLLPLTRIEKHNDMVIVEPSEKVVFPELYEEYIEAVIYETHLHAYVAEQIARVTAMDNATQNADDIIEDLQATYNRIRQSTITQEIIMVSNAARGGGAK